jgi:Tfp pilus assembly protein PilN
MDRITKSEDEIKGRLAVISSLDSDRYRSFKVMDTISMLIPPRVWIESMNMGAKNVSFNGGSWEFPPISDFVSLLKQAGIFDNVVLKSINSTPASVIVPGVPVALQTQKLYQVSMDIKPMVANTEPAKTDKSI